MNRDMFHLFGTSPSFSMPIRRRRAALRLRSPRHASLLRMTQEDLEHDDAPQDLDRIIVASASTPAPERLQQPAVRQEGQKVADCLKAGAVFEGFPGEQGLRGRESQGVGSLSPRR